MRITDYLSFIGALKIYKLQQKNCFQCSWTGHGHSHAGSSHGHSHGFGGGHSHSHVSQVQSLLKSEFENDDFHNDFHTKKKQDCKDGGHGHSHDGGDHGHSHGNHGHSHGQYDASGNPQVSSKQIMNGEWFLLLYIQLFFEVRKK